MVVVNFLVVWKPVGSLPELLAGGTEEKKGDTAKFKATCILTCMFSSSCRLKLNWNWMLSSLEQDPIYTARTQSYSKIFFLQWGKGGVVDKQIRSFLPLCGWFWFLGWKSTRRSTSSSVPSFTFGDFIISLLAARSVGIFFFATTRIRMEEDIFLESSLYLSKSKISSIELCSCPALESGLARDFQHVDTKISLHRFCRYLLRVTFHSGVTLVITT